MNIGRRNFVKFISASAAWALSGLMLKMSVFDDEDRLKGNMNWMQVPFRTNGMKHLLKKPLLNLGDVKY